MAVAVSLAWSLQCSPHVTLRSPSGAPGGAGVSGVETPSISDLVWACDMHDFEACNRLLNAPSAGAPVSEDVAQHARRMVQLGTQAGIQACYGCLLPLAPAHNDPARWRKMCEGDESYACANLGPKAVPGALP